MVQLDSTGVLTTKKIQLTGSHPQFLLDSTNRLTFNEINPASNETGSVVAYGSGSSSRNMVFSLSKTGVKTGFFGMDGSNFVIGAEAGAGIVLKTGLNYLATDVLGSGITQVAIDSTGNVQLSGNLFIQGSGTLVSGTGGISLQGVLRTSPATTSLTTSLSGSAAGTGATCSCIGNSNRGTINVTAGSGSTSGLICEVTFPNPFPYIPTVVVSQFANVQVYVFGVTSNSFLLISTTALINGITYKWNWIAL